MRPFLCKKKNVRGFLPSHLNTFSFFFLKVAASKHFLRNYTLVIWFSDVIISTFLWSACLTWLFRWNHGNAMNQTRLLNVTISMFCDSGLRILNVLASASEKKLSSVTTVCHENILRCVQFSSVPYYKMIRTKHTDDFTYKRIGVVEIIITVQVTQLLLKETLVYKVWHSGLVWLKKRGLFNFALTRWGFSAPHGNHFLFLIFLRWCHSLLLNPPSLCVL